MLPVGVSRLVAIAGGMVVVTPELAAAAASWACGEAYFDNAKNYRVRTPGSRRGRVAPWNLAVKREAVRLGYARNFETQMLHDLAGVLHPRGAHV